MKVEELIAKVNPRYGEPIWENEMNYETNLENLQPVYFWIIDFAQTLGFKNLEKIKDNFTASPGSSYFADLNARARTMQEESIKIMGYVNTVIKSITNLIYDLKEWDMLLKDYDNANSKSLKEKEVGILSLKQRWMSTVDAKRGMGSIDNMAHQYGFTILRPAFVAAKSAEDIDKMDLNDLVKRALKPRVAEFFEWVEMSEIEMRKRYNIEKSYLKNQIDTLKLYTSWVKPYLASAEQLRMKVGETPSLVSVFSTMVLELELLGSPQDKVDIADRVVAKDLPRNFKRIAGRIRPFYPVILINFSFRTFPTQQSMLSGKVKISFKAYAFNGDEMLYLKKLRKDKEMEDLFGVTSITQETLNQLKDDIEKYTKDEEKKEESMFSGIFEGFMETLGVRRKKEEKKAKEGEFTPEEEAKLKSFEEKKEVPKDSYEESVVRELVETDAGALCFKIYDVFKKARGMASFVSPFDEPDIMNRLREKRAQIMADLKSKGKL
jgi:hypothetical protein